MKHVDGSKTKVADVLSCYYEYDSWEDKCPPEDHVDADIRLDPNHDKLSWEIICEVKDYKGSLTAITIPAKPASIQDNEPTQDNNPELDPSIHESRTCGENLQKQMNQNDSFAKSIRDGYPNDRLYSKILAQPKCHPTFRMHNELLWTCNINKEWVVCVPHR
jgi:hypothetical protein